MKDEKDTMKQFLQKQPYRFTIAKHTLGIHQMRVMAQVVNQLQPFMTMEVDYTNPMDDVWLEIGVAELVRAGNVKALRDALEGLMKKTIRIMHFMPKKAVFLEIGTPIIQEYEYEHGGSLVKLKISGRLLPQIIDLAKGYTKYNLSVAFQTSSPNVFKLYQYFSHFRDKKQIQCNVDTLRQWLQLEDKYAKPAYVVRDILKPAIKELKEKADVWFDISERIMNGRKMIGWKFNIYTKKHSKSPRLVEKVKPIEIAARKKKEVATRPTEEKKKAEVLWTKCLTALKKEITLDQYDTWICPIKPESLVKNTLKLGVPDSFFAKKVEEVFLSKIMENIDGVSVSFVLLDRKKEREERETEKKKEEEGFLEKLQKTYGLSERQAYKVEGAMESNSSNRKIVMGVLKEIDCAKRDGKIRSSIGGATASKLQIQLGIKLY